LPPFSVSSGSAAVKLSQSEHFPSSPPSEEDAGTISLLLDTGAVSLLLDAGKTLELETSPELDSGVSLDAGADELDDSTSAELELSFSSAELDTGATLEDELSGTEASVPELESSPQATNTAATNTHIQKRIPLPLIPRNIPNYAYRMFNGNP
jgi:hypothetical protein